MPFQRMPPPALIAYLRIFGGPMLRIAVLNWMARNAEPSQARNAIVLGNIVGFGCVTAMDPWGVFSGSARQVMKVFLVIHLFMCRFRPGSSVRRASPTELGQAAAAILGLTHESI
jgi:hypothetical protein